MSEKLKIDIIIVSILLLVISGFAYAEFGQLSERIFFALSMGIMLVATKRICINAKNRTLKTKYLYYGFVGILLFDGILYLSVKAIVYAVAMGTLYFFCYTLVAARHSETFEMFIIKMQAVIGTFVLLRNYLLTPFTISSYRGIYENPNTLGIFAAAMATTYLILWLDGFLNKKHIKLFVFLFVISSIMTIASSCRIAVLALITEIMIALYVFYFGVRNTKKNLNLKILLVLGILLLITILCISGVLPKYLKPLMVKSGSLKVKGDQSNGRFEMWLEVIQKAKLFYSGQSITGYTVHNVYLGLIDAWGWIPGILFFLFMLEETISCGKILLCKRKSDISLYYYPFMVTVLFLIVSITENYLMTTPMIMMFLSFATQRRISLSVQRRPAT